MLVRDYNEEEFGIDDIPPPKETSEDRANRKLPLPEEASEDMSSDIESPLIEQMMPDDDVEDHSDSGKGCKLCDNPTDHDAAYCPVFCCLCFKKKNDDLDNPNHPTPDVCPDCFRVKGKCKVHEHDWCDLSLDDSIWPASFWLR